ncbi:hypothetical protein EDB19DRAFT_1911807 [Suillus lakei]|nr:hypothetical protein EDB19DRAFT_1911807 [Suillus lakei]
MALTGTLVLLLTLLAYSRLPRPALARSKIWPIDIFPSNTSLSPAHISSITHNLESKMEEFVDRSCSTDSTVKGTARPSFVSTLPFDASFESSSSNDEASFTSNNIKVAEDTAAVDHDIR